MRETKEVARSIRKHVLDSHALVPRIRKAIVREDDPLRAELTSADLVLDDNDLTLGTWARMYDRMVGIAVGDTLYVVQLESREWLVVEVGSDNDLDVGLGSPDDTADASDPVYSGVTPAVGATVHVTPSEHIVASVPYTLPDGTTGFIPIFGALA